MINRNFPGYHWIYWVGPLLGSLLASGFYHLLVLVKWENINPGQDLSEWDFKSKRDSISSGNTAVNGSDDSNGTNDELPRSEVRPEEQV